MTNDISDSEDHAGTGMDETGWTLASSKRAKRSHMEVSLYSALKGALDEKFTCQHRGHDEMQVNTANIAEYHRAIKALQAIGAQHSQEFAAADLPVQNCWFLENRHKREKCDALVIEVPQSCDSAKIYALREFAGMLIRVDDYKRPSGPNQCSNCQRFGHVGKGCNASPVCRWCSSPHCAPDCPQGGVADHKRCTHCKLQHCANYKGCEEYKRRGKRQPQTRMFKKNATGHKNGKGKYPQPTEDRPHQPAQDKLLAAKTAPAAPTRHTPVPAQPQAAPAPVETMAVEEAPVQPTAPPEPRN
ncbi:uncharacterized protein LOC134534878 [Bacillus rossius redtenbacheri]|uniref:uncharacterized protein LOC134534878 n=1 Tax=Bacillus rossius redtenbacheri TaxID=93214 RepID=UPI002FDE0078